MKAIIGILTLGLILTIGAVAHSLPREVAICPQSAEVLLEVANFTPSRSADSRANKGQCAVKTVYYSWWDLIQDSSPKDIIVDAGSCESKDFIYQNNVPFIKSTLSYLVKVSSCKSNPGCNYECLPIVSLWSL